MLFNNIEIKENERVDDLHRNGYSIIQNTDSFCFGCDAVLLSGFAKAKKGEKVMDLGTGTGVIPILMEAKSNAASFTAIEIQKDIADMAFRSVKINNLQNKINILNKDIKNICEDFKAASFDVVTSNPPYMNNGGGFVSSSNPKAVSRHEILCSLDDVAKGASWLLKFGGRFYMVHRPNRLADIICSLRKYSLEPKHIRLVQPYADKEPNIVLIEALKNGKPFLKILPNLIMYNPDGSYTDEVKSIYYE